jgi:thioredoxin 1
MSYLLFYFSPQWDNVDKSLIINNLKTEFYWSSKFMNGVVEIADRHFREILDDDMPVLVYFWAAWCGPCRLVSPSIDWAAKQYGDRLKVVKLEIDPNPDAVAQCKVEGVPALRLFKNREIIASHEGAIGKQQLETMLESHL